MHRNSHFFLLILLLCSLFCLTNAFADENGARLDIEEIIAAGDFAFPTPDGPGNIQDTPDFQIGPENIFGTNDFEKLRNFPSNSQEYILSQKVGWLVIPFRFDTKKIWICTGFLVAPDLFMTNHHCIHDNIGLLPLQNAAIYMDYYQEPEVDPTRGGLTARVTEVVKMNSQKDYALLRLNTPIGNSYGWLELATSFQATEVKLISHNKGRSKEIVRNNTQIVDIPPAIAAQFPFVDIAYLADAEGGASGSPVFSLNGTDVIAIHRGSLITGGVPVFNVGTTMAKIVPDIQQFLPASPPPGPANQPPAFAAGASIDTIDATVGTEITPQVLPAATDADGDAITYAIDPTLPPGVFFSGTTRLLFGTPTAAQAPTVYTYTASDGTATAELNFVIEVNATPVTANAPPAFAADASIDTIDATVGTAITPQILPAATDADGDTITYTLAPDVTPIGLTFEAGTRLLKGTPTAAQAPTVYTYTASDGTATAELTFIIQVNATPVAPNSPPAFAPGTFIANIIATVDTPIAPVILPAATDADGDTITYALAPALPAGLTFEASTRLLKGTPTAAQDITVYTYTASDGKPGGTTALTFSIDLTGEMPAYAVEDVNGDGQVNVIDLAIVALFYGTQVPPGVGTLAVDVNYDGKVDFADLKIVAESIDAVGNAAVITAADVSAVLDAVTAQVNALEAIPEAPGRISTAQQARVSGGTARNIAAALEAVKHRATADARLGKWLPLLKDLLLRVSELRDIPATAALLPNYPNPFNPETWIPYHLATEAEVTLTIYDVRGTPVRTLAVGQQAPGIYQSKHRAAYWDGRNATGEKVASGVYFYTLTAGEFTATRKLLIRK